MNNLSMEVARAIESAIKEIGENGVKQPHCGLCWNIRLMASQILFERNESMMVEGEFAKAVIEFWTSSQFEHWSECHRSPSGAKDLNFPVSGSAEFRASKFLDNADFKREGLYLDFFNKESPSKRRRLLDFLQKRIEMVIDELSKRQMNGLTKQIGW